MPCLHPRGAGRGEATRLHQSTRCCCGVAGLRARAIRQDVADRIPRHLVAIPGDSSRRCLPEKAARAGACRGQHLRHRIPLGRGAGQSPRGFGSRVGSSQAGCDRNRGDARLARSQAGNQHDPDRVRIERQSGGGRSRSKLLAAGRATSQGSPFPDRSWRANASSC